MFTSGFYRPALPSLKVPDPPAKGEDFEGFFPSVLSTFPLLTFRPVKPKVTSEKP